MFNIQAYKKPLLSAFALGSAAYGAYKLDQNPRILQAAHTQLVHFANRFRVVDPSVTSLSLVGHGVSRIDLSRYPNLRKVELSSNDFRIPPSFAWNPVLEKVSLTYNGMEIPPSFRWNPSLQEANLSSNNLRELPFLRWSSALTTLNLSENKLSGPIRLNNASLKTARFSYNSLGITPQVPSGCEVQCYGNPLLNGLGRTK